MYIWKSKFCYRIVPSWASQQPAFCFQLLRGDDVSALALYIVRTSRVKTTVAVVVRFRFLVIQAEMLVLWLRLLRIAQLRMDVVVKSCRADGQ